MELTSTPLLWEQLLSRFSAWLKRKKIPFSTAMVVGLLAYTFAFTNKLLNQDEVQSLFEKGSTVTFGRWGLGALKVVFPNLSMPWIYGILTLVLLALSVCLITDLFHIKSGFLQGLVAGCFLAAPSLTATFSYMFTSSSYALSFLAATTAVILMNQKRHGLYPVAVAVMVFSLSVYQAYISVAASMLVLILIQELMEGSDILKSIQKGIRFLLFLILSLGIYYLMTQVVNRVVGLTYIGYSENSIQFSIAALPVKMLLAYQYFARFFLDGSRGLIPTTTSQILHLLTLGSALVLLAVWGLRTWKKDALRVLLTAVLVLLSPLAVNCMFLFTEESSVHTLVLYGFVNLYLLFAVLVDGRQLMGNGKAVKLTSHLIPLCLSLMVAANIYLANAVFLNLHLRYEIAYSFYNSLVADIKMMPEFDEDTKLAVIGYYEEPEFYEKHFAPLEEIMGVRGFRPSSYSKERFLKHYLDFDIPMATDAEIAQLQQTEEFQQMPLYPYYGSMQLIGDTIVVRLE